mgnify:CR=1 FL=1
MSKVKIIPCSGIGKVMGLLSREVALEVTEHLCPDKAETACLGHIVTGDASATAKVVGSACIAVDGCPALCAAKSIEAAGGTVTAGYRVIDELRNHRGKKPGDGTALTEEGWQIVDEFAEKIADKVDEILQGGENNG